MRSIQLIELFLTGRQIGADRRSSQRRGKTD
jgi:hypothetical protein